MTGNACRCDHCGEGWNYDPEIDTDDEGESRYEVYGTYIEHTDHVQNTASDEQSR